MCILQWKGHPRISLSTRYCLFPFYRRIINRTNKLGGSNRRTEKYLSLQTTSAVLAYTRKRPFSNWLHGQKSFIVQTFLAALYKWFLQDSRLDKQSWRLSDANLNIRLQQMQEKSKVFETLLLKHKFRCSHYHESVQCLGKLTLSKLFKLLSIFVQSLLAFKHSSTVKHQSQLFYSTNINYAEECKVCKNVIILTLPVIPTNDIYINNKSYKIVWTVSKDIFLKIFNQLSQADVLSRS